MDIGGSGIKGCVVDLDKGELVGERVRIPTPQPALPDPVYGVVADIVGQFGWEGRIGVTYPGVMKHGVTFTAANMDSSWIGTDMAKGLEAVIPGTVQTLNDADAAGLAEVERAKQDGRWEAAYESQSRATVPPDLVAALAKSRRAAKFFETLSSANRYAILFRIHNAKKPETRAKRIATFVEMLAKHETLYP